MTTRYGDRVPKATDHWVPVSGGANRGGYMNHCGGDCMEAKAMQLMGVRDGERGFWTERCVNTEVSQEHDIKLTEKFNEQRVQSFSESATEANMAPDQQHPTG